MSASYAARLSNFDASDVWDKYTWRRCYWCNVCQLKKGVVSEILKGYNFAISGQISKGSDGTKIETIPHIVLKFQVDHACSGPD